MCAVEVSLTTSLAFYAKENVFTQNTFASFYCSTLGASLHHVRRVMPLLLTTVSER